MEFEYLRITLGPDEKTIIFPVTFALVEDIWYADCDYFNERVSGESKEMVTQTLLNKIKTKLESQLNL